VFIDELAGSGEVYVKAVILSGGKGTRLAPFTMVLPKPLLPLGGIPILEIVLHQLRHAGITDVVLACGYLAELIQVYLNRNPISQQLRLQYHIESEPLGTAGALAQIPGLEETFLVMNGDILTSLDFQRLLRYHLEMGADLTVAVTKKRVQIELGVLLLDERNRVVGYDEKPVKEYPASMGIYVYDPGVLAFIEPERYLDFPNLVLRLIDAKRRVMCYHSDDIWFDIGNRDDFERAAHAFEQHPQTFCFDCSLLTAAGHKID
jgi:NDP-sugar pyrophosphorylase family protein